MAKRFIKLYEQITSWEWFRHPNTLALFIYLLVKAYYKDTHVGGRLIRRGQLVTSLPSISTDTGLSIQQIRTALSHLKSTGEVTDESNHQYRIITVVKYDEYQSSTDKSTDDQQTINRRSNRQSTDDSTPYIENIEQIESNRNIEHPSGVGSAKRFIPPTKETIFDFCIEEGLNLNVDKFYDHYTSNGWKVGKNPMKDWKATARNWVRRDQEQPVKQAAPVKRVVAQQYEQRDYSDEQEDAMQRMIAMYGGNC